ncbi:MAG: ORF6N domain-containing protein [Selenomonadaceae bacterium]|nr:ORF6N domain-containing protein [Selenomonadaceae bacterium]
MEEYIKIEWAGQIVLTTKQLAAAYKVKPRSIQKNFDRAKEYFKEGEHYFKLTGEPLHQLKRQVVKNGIEQLRRSTQCRLVIAPSTASLFLWTHKGCAHHCKMLNTQAAWTVFNEMERVYFGVQVSLQIKPSVQPALFEDIPPQTKEVTKLQKQLAAIDKFDFAVVYILLMSNGSIKIGYTSNLTERIKQLKAETKLDVLNYATTPFMSVDKAKDLEKALHEHYAAYREEGEFFDVKFTDAILMLR